jgi:energy-converting hydrogenase Eha subunit E
VKHMETGEFRNHPLMRLTLSGTVVFLAGLWVSAGWMYFRRMGLTAESVRRYYLGSAEDFSAPRSLDSMLETAHVHLPIIGITMLFLTHLLIFAPWSFRAKAAVIAAAFAAALLNETAGWLVRFVSPAFAPLKVISFLSFEAILGFLLAALAWLLWSPHPSSSPRR